MKRCHLLIVSALALAVVSEEAARADGDQAPRFVAGLGPTVFALNDQLVRPGFLLDLDGTVRLGENGAFSLRLAWGITEFERAAEVAKTGYQLGRWTLHAYDDVGKWVGQGGDTSFLRGLASIYPFIFLIFPLVATGMVFLVAPFAATSYVELDASGGLDLSQGGVGPYLKGGVGFLGYIHPKNNHLLGGVGPTVSMGMHIDRFDVGLKGTWVPSLFHGEPAEDVHIFMASVVLGVRI
ncbi:MAG: hypothetical protein U1E65_16485 [Myxococcota bacterium]